MTRAPLRFLLAVLVLWTGARAAILLPGWTDELGPAPAAARQRPAAAGAPVPIAVAREAAPRWTEAAAHPAGQPRRAPLRWAAAAGLPAQRRPAPALIRLAFTLPAGHGTAKAGAAAAPWSAFPAPPPRPGQSRWSASAWILLRDEGDDVALAPGGMLGGSQVGARIAYAPGEGVALSGRAYLPIRQESGAEVAAGLDWRPVRTLPVNLLAERRQRLGRHGRNAFALTVYGGGSRDLTPRVQVDLYAQTGVVGLRRRDLFVDGAARLSRRIGAIEIGGGVWGAAQSAASRLDAGPSLSWRMPVRDANLRLQADWRFRVAGDALPRSGPALTLAADF